MLKAELKNTKMENNQGIKKVNTLAVSTGEVEESSDERAELKKNWSNARTVYDIIGGDGKKSRFPSVTEEEFEVILKDMSTLDQQKLAVEVGLVPVAERLLMEKRLRQAFKAYLKTKARKLPSLVSKGEEKKVSKGLQRLLDSVK